MDTKAVKFKQQPFCDRGERNGGTAAVGFSSTGVVISWRATGDIDYEYCVFAVDNTDTTPISVDDTCTYTDETWFDAGTQTSVEISTTRTFSGMEVVEMPFETATTYYWQVRSKLAEDGDPVWLYGDHGVYWSFTTSTP